LVDASTIGSRREVARARLLALAQQAQFGEFPAHAKKLENDLITSLNDKGKLAFLKTRETQSATGTRFSVSMGIVPDYTFSGTGVRADGVTDGKPAQKAGIKAGDIIVQLGDTPVSSLENYMQALGKIKKGDKAKVKFKRGNETLEAMVEF